MSADSNKGRGPRLRFMGDKVFITPCCVQWGRADMWHEPFLLHEHVFVRDPEKNDGALCGFNCTASRSVFDGDPTCPMMWKGRRCTFVEFDDGPGFWICTNWLDDIGRFLAGEELMRDAAESSSSPLSMGKITRPFACMGCGRRYDALPKLETIAHGGGWCQCKGQPLRPDDAVVVDVAGDDGRGGIWP